jgi:phosphatidylserine synthase
MKRVWITILGILNIIASGLLAAVYYCGFDLYTGVTQDAFTWGLPMPIAAILALICGIFTLKRKSWRWAVTGLIVAGAALLYIWIQVYLRFGNL